MSAHHPERAESPLDIREKLTAAVDKLELVLPCAAPLYNFNHLNTLQGYEHLPFTEALEAYYKLTGLRGYLPEKDFRKHYARGRIDDADLNESLRYNTDGRCREIVLKFSDRPISKQDIWRISLIHDISPLSPSRFRWQINECSALRRFQDDVPKSARDALLGAAQDENQSHHSESETIRNLWETCLKVFQLEKPNLHSEELEELVDLEEFSHSQAEGRQSKFRVSLASQPTLIPQKEMLAEARRDLSHLFEEVGEQLSLRGLLQALTGEDLLDQVRPILIRFCASHLDEGLAAWNLPHREQGLYMAWRGCSPVDFGLDLAELPDGWHQFHAELPEHSVDAVITCLQRLRIPESRWDGYLKRIALEIPGWSGLINWRYHRPQYKANQEAPASLMDYLAIRLFLDVIWIEHISQNTWGIAGNLNELKTYFETNPSEFLGRYTLFSNKLPEYLAVRVQELVMLPRTTPKYRDNWHMVANMIQNWKHNPSSERGERQTVHSHVWRLFLLAQYLGLPGSEASKLSRSDAEQLLAILDELTDSERGYIWLCAYEYRYREDLFNALVQNHGRARWLQRDTRPEAQAIFCFDDREEGIRRHLEETNPNIETLGSPGFFGVPQYWQELDATSTFPHCPVFVKPLNEVHEEPRPGAEKRYQIHKYAYGIKNFLKRVFFVESRRNLLSSKLLIDALSPGVLAALAGKVFFPFQQAALSKKINAALVPPVPTQLAFSTPDDDTTPTPDNPRLGFTNTEQANRLEALMRAIGLTSGFAPLVVLIGHGSIQQNNPHYYAYGCGACNGRRGGPNARLFATIVNRPEIRAQLAERGIRIPDDTWFIGAEHDTCTDEVFWFDLDHLPPTLKPNYEKLKADIEQALMLSAHERCRRMASAPKKPSLQEALSHVRERGYDFSQPRQELGHAASTAAVIGRRSVTRGLFLDRRVYVLSNDSTVDKEAKSLEFLLRNPTPIGVGITFDYYFSAVNNEGFGSGSKVAHNVVGLFGVMQGTDGDLRTWAYSQMVDVQHNIHEPMRLLAVVEATPETLTAIYMNEPSSREPGEGSWALPSLRKFVDGGWLLLSSIHPKTGKISIFDPKQGGFIPWKSYRKLEPLPVVERSMDWYDGHSELRPPALIEPKQTMEVHHAV
ncbi:DUF2309 domain-containing protein [Nitrosococcus watsonii]|uniref:Probable inorganic carbon transporter subunit DabA n=1 Tax=Nitrosococcus watsoni (strain C-113) TaxID=105559 RepID=D8K596_NITWC|nr:DUF2309 domain-containing protein [Nitrosococcus watsonii]ADJ28073.1 Protein of unknown function DUF2309 [Nitrosococcus watsonii C-113]